MNRFKQDNRGVAWIIGIVGVLIIIMLILILVPKITDSDKARRVQMDKNHVTTAKDSGRIYFASNGAFTAIYDYYNKSFVKGRLGIKVEPYGESDDHEGMVIWVTANKNGEVTTKWDYPAEVPSDVN